MISQKNSSKVTTTFLIFLQNLVPFTHLYGTTEHGEYSQFNYGHLVLYLSCIQKSFSEVRYSFNFNFYKSCIYNIKKYPNQNDIFICTA